MSRRRFASGLGWGVLLGLGMVVGAALTIRQDPLADLESRLWATATHGGDSMALATGPIDAGIEGVFILDYITGELTCQVVNPRTGTLAGLYRRNVVQDLGVEQGKQPKYLMVTGAVQSRQNISNIRPAESLLYVADSSTGHYVCYLLPWNRVAFSQNLPQASQMIPIGRGSVRQLPLEK